MHNGCILCGDVGSGKSKTSLAYYFKSCEGDIDAERYERMRLPRDLYIITTARKRDSYEWESELGQFFLVGNIVSRVNEDGRCDDACRDSRAYPSLRIVIDSWNNIKKYRKVHGAFFIFDEQRVVGKGAWVKAFIEISRKNQWILLSATPGDTWLDYGPVFVANGFFKSVFEYKQQHAIIDRTKGYPEIKGWINDGYLTSLRRKILVTMNYKRDVNIHRETNYCEYDRKLYKEIMKNRWDIYNDCPIENAAELCYILRRVVNSDPSRAGLLAERGFGSRGRAILFYNYDYERSILLDYAREFAIPCGEWNGHIHSDIPDTDQWLYLVQYTAGAEGWNCIKTDTIVFYSLNYSYKMMHQAEGRVNRVNSPFTDLYYHRLSSRSPIDISIERALAQKKNFNEKSFVGAV